MLHNLPPHNPASTRRLGTLCRIHTLECDKLNGNDEINGRWYMVRSRYGMIRYDMVWYGMVWYGLVWYGMVWYGMVEGGGSLPGIGTRPQTVPVTCSGFGGCDTECGTKHQAQRRGFQRRHFNPYLHLV